jgi:flagellar biosynthesis GTPase FlhF
MKKGKILIFSLSIVLLIIIVLGVIFGCSACQAASERRRLAEEATRLEAERLAAEEEAARLEAERLAAEEEAARRAAERLAAEEEAARRAAEAARRAAQGSSQNRQQSYRSEESDPKNSFVGIWATNNQAIVFRFRGDGNIDVLNYTLVDEVVEVYWRTNRGITGGGFYDTRNPEAYESVYTGTGSYTVTRDSVTIKLNINNHQGTTKNLTLTTRFSFNNQKDFLRLNNGLGRKFIINRDTRDIFDTKDFVTSFYRQ